jgi:outer membrane lipoprotein carrier protein
LFQILLVTFLTTISSSALAIDLEDAVSSIEAKYKDVRAMRAQFVQVVTSDFTDTEKTKGEVMFSRPSKMRWDFHGEDAKQYITDGRTLWLYSPAEKTVYKYDDVSAVAGGAGGIFDSLGNLDENYTVSMAPGAALGVNLTPRTEQTMKSLYLGFDEGYVLQIVRFEDAFGRTTELKLLGLELNPKTDDSRFSFTAPAGVEVISVGGF